MFDSILVVVILILGKLFLENYLVKVVIETNFIFVLCFIWYESKVNQMFVCSCPDFNLLTFYYVILSIDYVGHTTISPTFATISHFLQIILKIFVTPTISAWPPYSITSFISIFCWVVSRSNNRLGDIEHEK